MASGFEVGDIVWGKVESHPWWPGQICDEAMSPLFVRKTKFKGCLFVTFFGDNTYNWLPPKDILPFECHFRSKSNESKSKAFQEAVQEAINQVNLREELAFTCRCRNLSIGCRNPSIGCEEGADYPVSQVEKSRMEFKPAEMVSFLHKAALGPLNLPRDGYILRSAARILAYRKILFAEEDPTYDEAFDSDDEDPKWASNDLRKALAQGDASPIFSERDSFPALKGNRKGASSGQSKPIKACGESKRAKVEKAMEGPKVSQRCVGKASVFKNRYKCYLRNEGETEIVGTEAWISKPSIPLTLPLKKRSKTNIVGKTPFENGIMEKELASSEAAEADILDSGASSLIKVSQRGSSSSREGAGRSEGGGSALPSTFVNQWEDRYENSQQDIPPSLPPPPIYRNVYSRKTLSQSGNAMNNKHLESFQTNATTASTTAISTADIAGPIFKLLKEIDEHLEDLK